MKYIGAGIIPYSRLNGDILILLGKENNYRQGHRWSGFGGKKEHRESILETALRECEEESNNYGKNYLPMQYIRNKIKNNQVKYIINPRPRGYYLNILVNVPYTASRNDVKIVNYVKGKPQLEKYHIKYFTIPSLKRMRSNRYLRNEFCGDIEVIENLLQHKCPKNTAK